MTGAPPPIEGPVLVYGLAVAGEAVARALHRRGLPVVIADDRPTDASRASARELGAEHHEAPDAAALGALVSRAHLVVPSPGVPERHPVILSARAAGVPVRSEIDLAWEWEQQRPGGPRPMLAITGTDGKTTTTLLAAAMVDAGGRRALAAGNTELPLVTAIDDPDADVFVVECTSFRLAFAEAFRPDAAAWLNLAPDHLDWHASMETYAAAKARVWEHQGPADAAIGYAGDATVMRHLAVAPGRHLTFAAAGADYHVDAGWLTGPRGRIAEVASLRRRLPHDVTNALAAAGLVLEAGVGDEAAIASALARFEGVPHRIELVGEAGGVRWYDDSKATTPHAAVTAIRAFPSVVLVAGGRNKALDLRGMATEPSRMRAVVAIGEAAGEIAEAFDGVCPVEVAGSMDGAVEAAGRAAQPGDTVLLSPGCASFDWYSGYAARGDDFARAVRDHLARSGA